VPQLGVTEDGNWLILDHDKSRLQAFHLGKKVAERVLHAPGGESSQFSTFAICSPPLNGGANRLVLTASAHGREVQLWRHAPAEDRSREIRRLALAGNSPATVAAFSPAGVDKGFVVVGTERGDIHLWPIPTEAEIDRQWTARVAYVEPAHDPTGGRSRIWVELDNDAEGPYRLKPGAKANIVIQPK
jgi:hypothetical protein